MKFIILQLCAMLMFSNLAVAQQPPIENYLLTLTINDKEQAETKVSLVIASAEFRTDFVDSKLNVSTFQGTLSPHDNGTVSVMYGLAGSIAVPTSAERNASVNYKTISTQTTVCLKMNEPVQIIKSDARTCTLSVSKISDQPIKGK